MTFKVAAFNAKYNELNAFVKLIKPRSRTSPAQYSIIIPLAFNSFGCRRTGYPIAADVYASQPNLINRQVTRHLVFVFIVFHLNR